MFAFKGAVCGAQKRHLALQCLTLFPKPLVLRRLLVFVVVSFRHGRAILPISTIDIKPVG